MVLMHGNTNLAKVVYASRSPRSFTRRHYGGEEKGN
jgi:hypothetical protein